MHIYGDLRRMSEENNADVTLLRKKKLLQRNFVKDDGNSTE